MSTATPQATYLQQQQLQQTVLMRLLKKRSRLGWLRLLVFVVTVVTAWQLFSRYGGAGFVPLLAGLGLLVYLVIIDVANSARIKNVRILLQITEEELKALQNDFSFRDEGLRLMLPGHAYAADLDLFGASSVYQWLSRCYTGQGRQRLADNLTAPLTREIILARQAAVKEMAPAVARRLQWQAHAMQTGLTNKTEKQIGAWALEPEVHFTHPGWRVFLTVYSVVSVGTGVACLLDALSQSLFSLLFFFYLLTSVWLSRKALKTHARLSGVVKETATFQKLITWLEDATFTAPHFVKLQNALLRSGASASAEIGRLKTVLTNFDLRNNVLVFVFFNAFLLWDVRQLLALNKWRRKNSGHLAGWFSAIGEMEVLQSLSTLHFNYPQWVFPKPTAEHFSFTATQLGHPLLPPQQSVRNSFSLQGTPRIGVITGSNMAGKSTFLRSLGVNLVLAQAGAPVCATSFHFSPVTLVSSMRIADNLAENTSTFYAELKKLRTIIELVKTHQPLFILLDEILRGTNSFDRHKGSAALIKQLIKEEAVAVIATHDVELAALRTTFPSAIDNYHFDVEVEGEELYFDYKIKHGVCRSLNASILMKKIGIDLE